MTIEIYLDECLDSNVLIDALERAGFIVHSTRSAELRGSSDADQLSYCSMRGFVLLTRNPADFRDLHGLNPVHPGILLVYRDNVSIKDMRPTDIVRAVQNLLRSGVPIPNTCHTLNHWR